MYALVDCNNFYCSCETLFQPHLRNRPLVVLSNNDGCVISRSEEAKALGIPMGAPAFITRALFEKHGVVVYSSNYTLYGDISERVMKTLAGFVPTLEIYSIDEAFLDLHDMLHVDLLEMGISIRNTIYKHTGMPVTIGIAATKTLAKMANRYAKKTGKAAGVFGAIDHHTVSEMLASTAVSDVWGIGPQHAKLLRKHGMKTALQLSKAPADWMRKHMTVQGERLHAELRGRPTIAWTPVVPAKQNICTARGFGQLIGSKREVAEALSSYTANCAEKLRAQRSCTSKIRVFVETNAFRQHDKQYFRSVTMPLPVSTQHTAQLIKHALRCLDIIFEDGYLYHKCGIVVMDLVPEEEVQYGLFNAGETQREKGVMTAFDKLNLAFGKDTVRFAAQGFGDKVEAEAGKVVAALYNPHAGNFKSKNLKMFNPFEPFSEALADAFLKAGKQYLVSQTFRRDVPDKETILFTHYDDLAWAQIHLSAVKSDKFAAIINLANEGHRQKITQMLQPDSNYLVYSSLITSRQVVERNLNRQLDANMRRYISRNTNWKIGAGETIRPEVDLAFGELYIILKYRNQQIRFKLEELERI